jgi:hypothetical protein
MEPEQEFGCQGQPTFPGGGCGRSGKTSWNLESGGIVYLIFHVLAFDDDVLFNSSS